jgi:hypothetical protein
MTEQKPTPENAQETSLAQKDVKILAPCPPEQAKAPDDEHGGFKSLRLPEPTRYGDWESNGRCSDF